MVKEIAAPNHIIALELDEGAERLFQCRHVKGLTFARKALRTEYSRRLVSGC